LILTNYVGETPFGTMSDALCQSHVGECIPYIVLLQERANGTNPQITQRHGLFAASEGQILDMSLFEMVPDIDMRWKAWSKVESAKK
jgi:hypothetical protein